MALKEFNSILKLYFYTLFFNTRNWKLEKQDPIKIWCANFEHSITKLSILFTNITIKVYTDFSHIITKTILKLVAVLSVLWVYYYLTAQLL